MSDLETRADRMADKPWEAVGRVNKGGSEKTNSPNRIDLVAMNPNPFPSMGRILYGFGSYAILDHLFSHTSGRLTGHVDSTRINPI